MPRRRRLAVLILVVASCAVACTSDPATVQPEGSSESAPPRTLMTAILSQVAQDRYVVAPLGDAAATVHAPPDNVDSNLRVAFWDASAVDLVDSYSCATWQSASADTVQEGVALRVTSAAAGARAILVTKNVFLGGVWVFNVDVWDASAPGLSGLSILANVDLGSVFNPDGRLVPLPWHICARAVGGDVTFKAWPAATPEPAWGDPRFGASVRLPDGWTLPGKPGWFIGHVAAGGEATYSDMRAGGV